MPRPRVLVSRPLLDGCLDPLRELADLTLPPGPEGFGAGLGAAVADHEYLICQLTDPVGEELFAANPQLRHVSQVAVGYDNIDVPAAVAHGVLVTNTPGVLTEATADLTFALILATARRLPEAERFLREGRWQSWAIDLLCGRDVHGARLGILGMGRIGQAVARRARGFGMEVRYHSRRRLPTAAEAALGLHWCEMPDLLSGLDFFSLHLPLGPATQGLVDAAFLDSLGEDCVFINTARGGLVDEEALLGALREGRIAAAGLDVFAQEPAFDQRFLALDRVVLLPHIGSASWATRRRMCELAVAAVVDHIQGRDVAHPVDP